MTLTVFLMSLVALLGYAVIRMSGRVAKEKEQKKQREEALEDAEDLVKLATDDDVVSSLRDKAKQRRRKTKRNGWLP